MEPRWAASMIWIYYFLRHFVLMSRVKTVFQQKNSILHAMFCIDINFLAELKQAENN